MIRSAGIAWYSTATIRPPIGVVVFVRWSGRPPFEASHVRHPHERQMAWLVDDNGKPVFLPTDRPPADQNRPWAGWHTLKGDPDYWRPKHPDKWQMPLPEPAFIEAAEGPEPQPRMWSSTTRFSAVEDAEAEDLAREMEGWRADARAGGRKPDAGDVPESQWWLDPSAVTYSPPGKISSREAEGRLMRAFGAERWVRLDRPSGKTFGDVLAQLAKYDPVTAAELAEQDMPTRAEPTGRDRDDMLTALAWLKGLPRVEWERYTFARGKIVVSRMVGGPNSLYASIDVLRLRSLTPPFTWRAIGKAVHRSHESARGLYKSALGLVAAEANGNATEAGDRARTELAALRDRNRAYKRNG